MKKRRFYESLRFKIMAGVLLSLLLVLTVTSCLRYMSYRRQLMDILQLSEVDSSHLLATYLADYLRSRILLTAMAVLVTVLVAYVMMSRIVLGRLSRFLAVVNEVGHGNLDERVPIHGGACQDSVRECPTTTGVSPLTVDQSRESPEADAQRRE